MRKIKGITLIEILLVLVIMSSIILLVIGFSQQKVDEVRRDRTVLQYQAILNAGLSYYVNTGKWPNYNTDQISGPIDANHDLVKYGYLPTTGTMTDPWGHAFQTLYDTKNNFYVSTSWPAINATQLARDYSPIMGRIPLGYTASAWTVAGVSTATNCAAGGNCLLTSLVPLPGQNLANARSVNFAGMYSSGGCVPAPVCPAGMEEQIFVVPTEVSGVYDPVTNPPGPQNIYPINSFSAFARGNSVGKPTTPDQVLDCAVENPPSARACNSWNYPAYGQPTPTPDPAGTKYWRACLAVVTEKGRVQFIQGGPDTDTSATYKGRMSGSIAAFTRCAPIGEKPSGSPFQYYEPTGAWLP